MARFKKAGADEARDRAKTHVRSLGGNDTVIKGFKSPPSWDKEKRSARFTMSSEAVDRYGDIVVQQGLDIERFMQNPQGLLFHNSRSWPCGTWGDVNKILNGRPKRTEGVLTLLPEGVDPDVDRAAAHVAHGTIRTVSIGFIPNWDEIEWILDDDEDYITGIRFLESELVECSLVPIPANPDALAKSAGGDMQLARDIIEDILDSYAMTPEGLLLPMDEYRAKHLDLFGERSFHLVKGLLRSAPKSLPTEALELKATTDTEAQAYVGLSVNWKPNHPENADEPAKSIFADCTGEIIASYIVDEGEFKGVHALAVEWSNKAGTPIGMYRGLKAERVLLAQKPKGSEVTGKCLLDAAAIDEFVDGLKAGDVVQLGEEHETMVSFMAMRDGKVVAYKKVRHDSRLIPGAETITVDRDCTLETLRQRVAEIAGEPEPVVEVTRETTSVATIESLQNDSIDTKDLGTIAIKVDATQAKAELTGLAKLADEVKAKLASIFGRQAAPAVEERQEPVIETKTVPAPVVIEPAPAPTDADIAAARAAADELISRYSAAA